MKKLIILQLLLVADSSLAAEKNQAHTGVEPNTIVWHSGCWEYAYSAKEHML